MVAVCKHPRFYAIYAILRSFAAILGPRNRLLETPATPRTPFSARLTLCFLEVTAADSVASERFSTASINVDRLGRR